VTRQKRSLKDEWKMQVGSISPACCAIQRTRLASASRLPSHHLPDAPAGTGGDMLWKMF